MNAQAITDDPQFPADIRILAAILTEIGLLRDDVKGLRESLKEQQAPEVTEGKG